jgi:hypothetical protein
MPDKYKAEIVKTYLKLYPDKPSQWIARAIFGDKRNKYVFKSQESVRNAIRYYRGCNGKKNMVALHDSFFLTDEKKAELDNLLLELPSSKAKAWPIYELPANIKKPLIIADLHIPYHDPRAIRIAIKFGLNSGADSVIINGDLIDIYALSFWQTDPRERDFSGELEATRTFLRQLRKIMGNKPIIYKQANHEYRYERYMFNHAPELVGCDEFKLENLLKLKEYGVEWVTDKRLIKANHLYITHGDESGKGIFNPVNPARGLYLKTKSNALCAHFHQTSSHVEKTLDGKIVSCFSIGCLCDLHPQYSPINNWGLGFAIIDMGDGDNWTVINKKILPNGMTV